MAHFFYFITTKNKKTRKCNSITAKIHSRRRQLPKKRLERKVSEIKNFLAEGEKWKDAPAAKESADSAAGRRVESGRVGCVSTQNCLRLFSYWNISEKQNSMPKTAFTKATPFIDCFICVK